MYKLVSHAYVFQDHTSGRFRSIMVGHLVTVITSFKLPFFSVCFLFVLLYSTYSVGTPRPIYESDLDWTRQFRLLHIVSKGEKKSYSTYCKQR